jgi:predicted transcriptional regulator
MPRVRGYTAEQKLDFQKKHVAEMCELLLIRSRVTRKAVAEFAGITQQAVSYQLRTGRLSEAVLMTIISLSDADAETVINMLKIRDAK